MITIRPAGTGDIAAVLGLFDRAVEWLVARGQTGQWGDQPWTGDPQRTALVERLVKAGGTRVAVLDGTIVGTVSLGSAPTYAPPAPVSELYVEALVTDRAHKGERIGTALLLQAREEALAAGVAQLRVDCWAGADGALVRYYEREGFTRDVGFVVEDHPRGPWHGQILVQDLQHALA
ncbi:GNAT family N-acetyltransferase [Actinomadura rupiterrae]|uniref:GNAT family N-acetyltransferase n=1 Tax=Actinomadura rupiterrae TaxID=559627 RepID=UPI0020A32581|nr:GNAT family N-acetyltransferase [Actinomadura rupiterrae]MCP2335257.1 GNAT superfamily N-acetyltransferase [Actinomadura rupiterrae]